MTSLAILNTPATTGKVITMTSLELVEFINSERETIAKSNGAAFPSKGYAKLQNKDFLAKVPEVLGKERSAEFSADLPDSYGRLQPAYIFLKREACLMAMSYSYELQAKVFDRMTALEKPMSPMEMVIQSAQAIMRIEAAQAEQDAKLAAMSARLDGLNGDTGYRTVTAFLRNEGIKKSLKDANSFGRNCTKLCEELGIKIGDVPDERFGSVHSYPVEVLREVLEGEK